MMSDPVEAFGAGHGGGGPFAASDDCSARLRREARQPAGSGRPHLRAHGPAPAGAAAGPGDGGVKLIED